ncbi:MAG: hypothetical protein QGD92_06510 [Gammaproteobacteria bacterium]|nr:hypothetical protein [Gammaproteobacteria bacterium]
MGEFVLRLLLLLSLVSVSHASPATIQLQDGSQLVGEITSYKNGVYSIDTTALGLVRVRDVQINSIHYKATLRLPGSDSQLKSGSADSIQSIQGILTQNSDLFAMIQALQNDPQLQAILADPEIMQAISTGNTEALVTNETFMKLLDHPEIRKITKRAIGTK